MENYIEQCKVVRKLTMAPMKDIAAALLDTKGDVDKAVELLVQRKATSAEDMANRKADNNIVYSYVHNSKVGAMIVLACQKECKKRAGLPEIVTHEAMDDAWDVIQLVRTKFPRV